MILFSAMMVGGHLLMAVADKVPDLNFEPICRDSGALDLAGKDDMQDCLKAEGTARDALAKQWSQFGPADRTRCLRLATSNGSASYVEVLTCLEMDRDAKTRHPTRDARIDAPEPSSPRGGEVVNPPGPPGVQLAARPAAAGAPPPPLPLAPPEAPPGLLQYMCVPGIKAILPACNPPAGDR
jgi:hypothetical protein